METRIRNFLGTIIVVSAIGMMVLKYLTNGNMDSYIMPFCFLFLSVVVFFNKSKSEKVQKIFSEKQKKLFLRTAIISLGAGVIVFFITLL